MNIEGGGDKSSGGDLGGGGPTDNLRHEAYMAKGPRDSSSEVAKISDSGLDQSVSEATTIAANVTNTTCNLRNRMTNDQDAQQNFDKVGKETCQVLEEQNARAKVPAVAAAMITAAFAAGVDKSMSA